MSLPKDFHVHNYKSFYKDLEYMSDAKASAHYKTYGIREGRVYKLNIPEDFNASTYKSLHPDLQHLTDIEASVHYTQYGKKEGRMYIPKAINIPVAPVYIPVYKEAPQIPTPHGIDFFVVIPSIKGYDVALDCIVRSIPKGWSYVIVFQKEEEDGYKVYEDGHIEVRLKRNIYEYGAWVGTQLLMDHGILPINSWCLFVHDTCKFGPHTRFMTEQLLYKYNDSKIDCIWLCKNGYRNICLVRRNAIHEGAKLYDAIHTMTKKEAIQGEIKRESPFSIKSLPIQQIFLHFVLYVKEKRKVYGTTMRNVEQFDSIDMEKYVFHVQNGIVHPHNP